MYTFVEVEQGSPEWKELRRTKIGASNSPALCNVHPYKDSVDVYQEMVLGVEPYVNAAMKHGSESEAMARNDFCSLGYMRFEPAVVVSTKYPFLMASLDGLNSACDQILEIKCPQEKVFLECIEGNYPKHWIYQIQHQMLVTGIEHADLFVWRGCENMIVHHVKPDKKIQSEILEACQKFYLHNLLEYKPPVPDFSEDEHLNRLVEIYLGAKEEAEKYEKMAEEHRKEIIAMCGDKPTITARARIERNEVKGKIDYSSIPELSGINLEEYRGPTTIRWRICATRSD